MRDDIYERVHNDALRVIKELGFHKYTVDMLDTFTYELTTMKENLEWQAKKRTAVAEVIPEAAQLSPRLFSLLETELDELGQDKP